IVLAIGMIAVIVGPRRPFARRLKPRYQARALLDVARYQGLAEAGLGERAAHIGTLVRVAPLQGRLCHHMHQHPWTHEVARRHEATHLLCLNAVDTAAQPWPEIHTAVSLQHQRVEEQLAELAVAHPGLAGL